METDLKLLSDCFRFTRLTLLQETEPRSAERGGEEKAEELQAVEHSISNHRDLLRQVTSYPNRKLKQPDFLPYDPADSLADPTALLPPEPCHSLSMSPSRRSEHRLKPLEELCNDYFLSLMKEQLADTESRLRGDRSVLRTARLAHSLSRRVPLVSFLFEPWSPEDGDEEERESAEAGRKSGVKLFQPEPVSSESLGSCVEQIQIKLEAGEGGIVTPEPSVAMEMAGSVSSNDSFEVLGTEKSYRTQQAAVGAECTGTKNVHLALRDVVSLHSICTEGLELLLRQTIAHLKAGAVEV